MVHMKALKNLTHYANKAENRPTCRQISSPHGGEDDKRFARQDSSSRTKTAQAKEQGGNRARFLFLHEQITTLTKPTRPDNGQGGQSGCIKYLMQACGPLEGHTTERPKQRHRGRRGAKTKPTFYRPKVMLRLRSQWITDPARPICEDRH
ncbi:hypothetical protein AVEN_272670-1 [Araneus ventricosus]|uniref:Uncharacterized protein n=1 Tax=Araneus ventricosus TaxID=182803 RepID=A0A4Y2NM11_ARAVE|nr:hypothetical protein AVEN_272670-1 [Araneus ventricosus]